MSLTCPSSSPARSVAASMQPSRAPSALSSPNGSRNPGGPAVAVDALELDIRLGALGGTRTTIKTDGAATAGQSRLPRMRATRALGSSATSPGFFYKSVYRLWDYGLVRPLQAVVALLGVVVGLVWVAAEATWDVARRVGSTLWRTFVAAVHAVRGQRHAAAGKQTASADETAPDGFVTPPSLPSPSLGGRTPSSSGSPGGEASGRRAAAPQRRRQHEPQAPRRFSFAPRPPEARAAGPAEADRAPATLPEAIAVSLPAAICSTCGNSVAPGGACEHVSVDVEWAVQRPASFTPPARQAQAPPSP